MIITIDKFRVFVCILIDSCNILGGQRKPLAEKTLSKQFESAKGLVLQSGSVLPVISRVK